MNTNYLKKYWLHLAITILLIIITLTFTIKKDEVIMLPSVLKQVPIKYIVAIIVSIFLFFLCQAQAVKILLSSLGFPIKCSRTMAYTLIDYYFSAITPGAIGGQPAEIFFMRRDGIDVGSSSLVMLIFNGIYHFSVVGVLLISSIIKPNVVTSFFSKQPIFQYLFLFGLMAQIFLVSFFCLLIFSKKLMPKILGALVSKLELFAFFRKKNLSTRLNYMLDEYRLGANWIKENPFLVLKLIPIGLLHIFLYYSVGFWVAKALGSTSPSLIEMVCLQGIFTMTFEALPLPSGVGIAERGFLSIFEPIYGHDNLAAAMLITRGLTFYLFLSVGAFTSLFLQANKVKRSGKFVERIKNKIKHK